MVIARKYVWLICLLLLLLSPGGSSAEDVIKYGTTFPVENIQPLDAQTSRVTVLGNELIVNNRSLEAFVIGQYLQSDAIQHLAVEEIFGFIAKAVDQGDFSLSIKALAAVVEHPAFSSLELIEFLEDLPDIQARELFYKQALNKISALRDYPDVLGALVFYVAQKDLRWLKTEGVRHVYLYGDAVKRYFKSRFYRSLAAADLSAMDASLEALRELFGSEDALYRQLNIIFIKLRQGIAAIERLDAQGMFALLDLTQMDPTLEKVLPPVIVQTVHRTAEEALADARAGKALTLLSWIELDWRTPTTHRLVAESLRQLEPEEVSNIIGTRIEKFLVFLAGKDSAVKEAYIDFLERDLRSKVNRGHFGQVETSLDRLKMVRPDPNSQNDGLRLYAIFALFDAGYQHAAREILDHVQTPVPFSEQIRLLVRGLLIDLTILVCAVAIPILLIVWLLLRRGTRQRSDEDEDYDYQDQDSYQEDREEEERQHQPLFASLAGKGRDPVYLQYTELLKRFDLDSDAGLKDIKQAYRRAIKAVHPDINPSVDQEGQERFIELTNTYERILKLRRRLGYPAE